MADRLALRLGKAVGAWPPRRLLRVPGVALILALPLHAQEMIDIDVSGTTYAVYGADALDEIDNPFFGEMTAGDLSGDGIADLVIGTVLGDGPGNARDACGDVHVIFGPFPDGDVRDMATRPSDPTIYGREVQGHFGRALAIADFNGDTHLDLAVGAPDTSYLDATVRDRGETMIFFGPLAPGVIDLALVEPGLHLVGDRSYDTFGSDLAVGDVSGDGVPDLIVGSEDSPMNPVGWVGAVRVLFGPLMPGPARFLDIQPADVVIAGNEDTVRFGRGVGCADVSGDGVADVLATSYWATSTAGGRHAGRVRGFFGPFTSGTTIDLRTAAPDLLLEGGDPDDVMGYCLATLDVNGDGATDLIVGAKGGDGIDNLEPEAGEVHVVFGPFAPGSVIDNQAHRSDVIFTGVAADQLGIAVAAAPLPGGGARLLVPTPDHAGCGSGEVYVIDSLPPAGSIVNLPQNRPPLTYVGDLKPGFRVLLAEISGDPEPEALISLARPGPAGDRPQSGAIVVPRWTDRCEQAPLGLGPHGIDVRRSGNDVLIDFDSTGLGEDSIGVDVYRGTIDSLRLPPHRYDHVLAANGCGVPAPPFVDVGAAGNGERPIYYLATRGCPATCHTLRLTGDMGFKSTGEPRPLPPWNADALTCR